jgi:hypothetical protein
VRLGGHREVRGLFNRHSEIPVKRRSDRFAEASVVLFPPRVRSSGLSFQVERQRGVVVVCIERGGPSAERTGEETVYSHRDGEAALVACVST